MNTFYIFLAVSYMVGGQKEIHSFPQPFPTEIACKEFVLQLDQAVKNQGIGNIQKIEAACVPWKDSMSELSPPSTLPKADPQ